MHGGLVKYHGSPGEKLVFVLSDHPLMVAFLAARINRPGVDTNLKQSVFSAVTAGGGVGALLRKGKLHPETSKQFDRAEADGI